MIATTSLFIHDEMGLGIYFLPGVIYGLFVIKVFSSIDVASKTGFVLLSGMIYAFVSMRLPSKLGNIGGFWCFVGMIGAILLGLLFLLLVSRQVNLVVFFMLLLLFGAMGALPLFLMDADLYLSPPLFWFCIFSVFPLWQTGFAISFVISRKKVATSPT